MGQWFYQHNGKDVGPIGHSVVRHWLQTGEIRPTQMIRPEGSAIWAEAGSFEELKQDLPRPKVMPRPSVPCPRHLETETNEYCFECDCGICPSCRVESDEKIQLCPDCATLWKHPVRARLTSLVLSLSFALLATGSLMAAIHELYQLPRQLLGLMFAAVFGLAGFIISNGRLNIKRPSQPAIFAVTRTWNFIILLLLLAMTWPFIELLLAPILFSLVSGR